MTTVRWTTHKVVDAAGTWALGEAPIDLWWIARAAAEETLQGAPMVRAWLTLFAAHLSSAEHRDLRWGGDLAESAELRRSYSGLYGRFVARALLTHHLGLSRFVSLERDGIELSNSISVTRRTEGDIPDWLAWDERAQRFVLCEAKGSLTATDFLTGDPPRCVVQGKAQFRRVTSAVAGRPYRPAEWVAASRWSTDRRAWPPVTLLWDPPVDQAPFDPAAAEQHRAAITRAWLDSFAPAFGFRDGEEILSATSQDRGLIVTAEPGPVPPDREWPRRRPPDARPSSDPSAEATRDDRTTIAERGVRPAPDLPDAPGEPPELDLGVAPRGPEKPTIDLAASPIFARRDILQPRPPERKRFEGRLVAALVTNFGIRPIRTRGDLDALRAAQEQARALREPAMLIGLPRDPDRSRHPEETGWLDDAGIAMPGDLAVFDLRVADVDAADGLPA